MGLFDSFPDAEPVPKAVGRPAVGRGMFDAFPDAAPALPAMDFNRPIEDIRADFAKIPEGPQRDALMKQWADAYVAKEREGSKQTGVKSAIMSPGQIPDVVRNFARGTIVGSVADELNAGTSALAHKATGGAMGAPYDEAVAYQRALDRALRAEPGSAVTEVAGALATGAPIAKAVMGGAKSIPGLMARGTGVGGTVGYVSGFGEGEGGAAERHTNATSGEGKAFGLPPVATGAIAGGVLPPVISGIAAAGSRVAEAASPLVARIGANVGAVPRRLGIGASADGAIPETAGARAAAEQIIANQASRAGLTAPELRNRLAGVEDATTFHTQGRAQDATALVDLDPAFQRLAGSAARSSPDAANVAKDFMFARQTGITPRSGPVHYAGLPTRPMLAPPVTGKQSIASEAGTDFGAGQKNIVPMGQGERLGDAFKRALRIEDAAHHGHASNAYRTDQQILEAARAEAKPLYGAAYDAGRNMDIRPAIRPVLDRWLRGDRLADEAEPVAALVRRVASLFEPKGNTVNNLARFDRTKQYIDGKIENYFESVAGRSRHIGGLLNELKTDLLKAVDGIQDVGEKYAKARSAYGSRMEARRAIEMGRDAFKLDSDIGVDAFRSLGGDKGLEKLFRLGLLSGYETAASRMKRGADKTQLFDNPRIQELLTAVIPRTDASGGKFHNRPERFGQNIGLEQRAVETRNTVQGGSPTQGRKVDDDAYNIMTRWGEMWDAFKTTGSVTKLAIDAAGNALGSLFGMRADTAASIARQLFTADPATRAQVLANIEARLGRNRFEQFTRLMEEHQRNVVAAGARQSAVPEGQQ